MINLKFQSAEVKSTNIKLVGFDYLSGNLYITFINGSVYRYPNSTSLDYQELINAHSVGKQFAFFKRNHLEFQKMS